jgi:hypothetical protein
MALRDSKIFRAFSYPIIALAIASFTVKVIMQVAKGNGAHFYHGGRGLPVTYFAALSVIVPEAIIGIIWFCQVTWRRWRHIFIQDNDD